MSENEAREQIRRMKAEVKQSVEEYRERGRVMSGTEFEAKKKKIGRENDSGAVWTAHQLQLMGSPEYIGQVAADYDIALVEISDDVNTALLRGIHVGGGKVVPVLICMNERVWGDFWPGLERVVRDAQEDISGMDREIMTDGRGLKSPGVTEGKPAENLMEQERWFCSSVVDGRKTAHAPWIDENPEGEKTGWGQMVGHNWDGVRTDYATAKEWAEKVPGWFMATKIGDYEDKSESRLHLLDFDDARDPDTEEIHPEVSEIMDRLDSYAQVSYSGTGVHIYVKGPVPEEYRQTGFESDLSDWKHREKLGTMPSVECYSRKRLIAITEKHIEGTPVDMKERPEELAKLYEKWGKEAPDKEPDVFPKTDDLDPVTTKTEVKSTEKTADWDVIFDAIAHAKPRLDHGNVQLRSEVTRERSSGIYDIDPSWETSESGARVGYDDGFIYRKSDTGMDMLQVVALEEHIIHGADQYPEGEEWFDAVDALRERGAHIPEYDADEAEGTMPMLPTALLESLSHDDAVRYAKRRGMEWPDVHEVRERLAEDTREAMGGGETTVISAPTGSGKSHYVSTEPWLDKPEVTGGQPVIHAHGTKKARDEAAERSEEHGLDYHVLKGRGELCPCAAGHHDPDNNRDNPGITIDGVALSDWIDTRCDDQGIQFSTVHTWAEQMVGGEMPCMRDQTECPAKGQFENIPRNDNGEPSHDIIHCTHQFLNVPGLRMHCNIVIDEKPSFVAGLGKERAEKAVHAQLDYSDAPVDNYHELVYAARTGKDPNAPDAGTHNGVTVAEHNSHFRDQMDEALNGKPTYEECPECKGEGEIHDGRADNQDLTAYPEDGGAAASNTCPECEGSGEIVVSDGHPPLNWYKENQDAHAIGPAITQAIWEAEEHTSGRRVGNVYYRPPRWGNSSHDEAGWNRTSVDVILNENWDIEQVSSVPSFSLARSVIGFDAHAGEIMPQWMANVDEEIDTHKVLSQTEETLYRRLERGLFVVQVMEGKQPVTSGKWLDKGQGRKFQAVINKISDAYDEWETVITSAEIEDKITGFMEEAGISDPKSMHYGEEESRNDFAGHSVGLVTGSIDPGDEMVVNICARLGIEAKPVYNTCSVCQGHGEVVEADDGEVIPADKTESSDVAICETCSGEGEVREHGRTFEGDGEDVAESALQSVREHHVAQSAGRWARDAEDPDDNATVYLATDAAPDGFVDAKAPGVTWATNKNQKDVLECIRDCESGVTASEITEQVGVTKRSVRRILKNAYEEGLLERTPGAGPHGAHLYTPDASGFNTAGSVDLGSGGQNRTDPVKGKDTWNVRVEAMPHCAIDADEETWDEWQYQSTFEWFEAASAPPG